MKKDRIRDLILKKMKKHGTNLALKKSFQIRQKFLNSEDYKKANSIFTYVSKTGEVDIRNIIKDAIKNQKSVYAPVIHNKQICVGIIKNFDEMTLGTFGVLRPTNVVNKNMFDIILVPGLAFDSSCARIGRGGGYFDRFLSLTKGNKVALAFDFQIIPKIDTMEHDIFMDKIITEKRTISRNPRS